ncbi:unnamed protein product [Brachionus calyciflorus]|uniref:Tetraspanin n=1 Tax=Brachionus calyciflorus TaxID=104777 RepID=A0A813U9X7_9BILA|nr:unnamed protein product [Brachionus calyciflorus]
MLRIQTKRKTTLKLTNGMRTVKFSLFIFSLLFLAFGLKLVVVGSILNVQFKDYLDFQGKTSISNGAILLITFGCVVTIVSFFGCSGSIRESRCMILTFSTFLIITFFCELVLIFVGFAFKDKMFSMLQEEMVKSINSTQPGIMKTWNVIQREFECCGFDGPDDWQKRGTFMPASCCKTDLACPNDDNPMYGSGCYESLTKWTSSNMSILGGILLIISVFQIFGTTFSCLLAKSIKQGYDIVD